MIAPMFGLYDLEFFLEKWLSVKVLINKDNFEIMGEFLVRWEFDFWVVKLGKCLILVGFDDMEYDKWFGMGKLGFCLILVGFLMVGKDGFLSWCVDKSAIGFAAFLVLLVSFYYPQLVKNIQ